MGVDITGSAPGGMASISRTLLSQFERREDVRLFPVTNFEEGSLTRRLYVGFRAAGRIALSRENADLVHLQVADGWSIERDLLLVLAARLRGVPVVSQFHGAGQVADYDNGNAMHRLGYRMLTRRSYNLALGEAVLSWLKRIGCADHSEIVPNGVSVPDTAIPLVGGTPRLAFVGRLGPRKGIYDLLEALEKIASSGTEFFLDVVGDGEVDEVTQRLRASPLLSDRVLVHGWIDEEQVHQILAHSRALVLPSYAEGLPVAILEAMALGRPIIATDVGEISTAVEDGANGFLIDPGDVAALERSVARLLTDRRLAESFGMRGHAMALRSFSDSALVERLTTIYSELAA